MSTGQRKLVRIGLGLVLLGTTAVFVLLRTGWLMPKDLRGFLASNSAVAEALKSQHPAASHSYRIENRTIHFVELPASPGDNVPHPLVLFIHGSPGDWTAWATYLADPDLLQDVKMIAVDRPGFGESDPGRAEPSLAKQSSDLAPLLGRAAPGQRIILVGHSFGGPVAARLAMDHPEKVTDLILLAGSVDPAMEKTKWFQIPAQWRAVNWAVPQELLVCNREILPLKSQLEEMKPLWPKITQRVTVVQGESDDLVPPENAAFAQRMLVSARSVEVLRLPGMNHFLPWNRFDLVKSLILKHVRDQPSAPSLPIPTSASFPSPT